ncbi:MAG: hypothetical protein R3B90_15760 [Planctomycetaceae bacterium]
MSHFLSQRWLIDRRHALRAMGTCISLPLLECMVPLNAAERPADTPRRSAFIYLANGVHSLNYQITTPGGDYEFSAHSSRSKSTATSSRRSAGCIIRERSATITTAFRSG